MKRLIPIGLTILLLAGCGGSVKQDSPLREYAKKDCRSRLTGDDLKTCLVLATTMTEKQLGELKKLAEEMD